MLELPDVPEAAVEAAVVVVCARWQNDYLRRTIRERAEHAVQALIEQGWADPTEVQRLTGLIGMHDPTGQDHMEEMWEHAQRADAAEERVRELEALLIEQGWKPPEAGTGT